MSKRALVALETLHMFRTWSLESLNIEMMRQWDGRSKDKPEGEVLAAIDLEQQLLHRADAFWVNEEMTDLIEAAAMTLPPDAVFSPPSHTGFVIFERHISAAHIPCAPSTGYLGQGRDRPIGLIGLRWAWNVLPPSEGYLTSPDYSGGLVDPGKQVEPRRTAVEPKSIPVAIFGALLDWDDAPKTVSGIQLSGAEARRASGLPYFPCNLVNPFMPFASATLQIFKTFCLLCDERVSESEECRADRKTSRRLSIAPDSPAPSISIIRLRRPRGPGVDSAPSGSFKYSKRFIVGGHWANRWVGRRDAKDERHLEPRWISPYIKGPADKPLVTDRVYELIR